MTITRERMNSDTVNEILSTDNNKKSATVICSTCGKDFVEKIDYEHLKIDDRIVSWRCDQCSSSSGEVESQSRLSIHENLSLVLVRPFKCSKCDNIFDRASQLDYHMRSVHLGERSQMCQICGKGFFRKTDLRTHLNVHLGTNQSICEICGRKFNHVSNLIRHCRTHAGSKPYPCTICGKRFTQISSLARHKSIHKRNSSLPQNDLSGKSNDTTNVEQKKIVKRHHYCRVCGESFQFMVLLKQHEKHHSKVSQSCEPKVSTKDWKIDNSKNDTKQLEIVKDSLVSGKARVESSTSTWREKFVDIEKIGAIHTASQAGQESTDKSIRDHLMELARKMNAMEIESDRDASISISDILSSYNYDEIQLSNGNPMESKLYEASTVSANKQEILGKDYDIVQCLSSTDFPLNIDTHLLESCSDKSMMKSDNVKGKSQIKDSKQTKFKPLASQTKDQYNKCLHLEGSQLYIEICESEYLKGPGLNAVELEDIENVALFQEGFESVEQVSKCSKSESQKKSTIRSTICTEIAATTAESIGISIDVKEPSLRLVQTETGDQFYELVINNHSSNDFQPLDVTKNADDIGTVKTSIISASTEDRDSCSIEKQLEDVDKPSNVTNSDEFLQFVPNPDNYKEIQAYGQNDIQTPMVRLVQNEDGEQFFELIREPLEYEKNRNSENTRDDKSLQISSNPAQPENTIVTSNLKLQSATSSTSGIKKDKKESIETTSRSSKDRTRKFQCAECDKWFSTAYNFKQHTGTHFSDQQKFQCKDCGLSFAWKSTLNKHLAGNHRPDGPQKFVCEICPKVYSTLSQMNEHVKRDHLKERNHVCPLCGKSFFKKFDLKTHSRTHTNERPYVCRACGKGFHHQSHIIRHERIHSGERPYTCDICQRTFTQPGSLKTHRQRHRDVKIDILEYRMDEDDPLTLVVQ